MENIVWWFISKHEHWSHDANITIRITGLFFISFELELGDIKW